MSKADGNTRVSPLRKKNVAVLLVVRPHLYDTSTNRQMGHCPATRPWLQVATNNRRACPPTWTVHGAVDRHRLPVELRHHCDGKYTASPSLHDRAARRGHG